MCVSTVIEAARALLSRSTWRWPWSRRECVSVRRVLPGAGHHGGHPGAHPAAPAEHGGGDARREGGRRAAAAPAEEDERRARGRPQVHHPVPEGLPAPGARALQRAHRAADPGGAAEHRPAQPGPAARRGAGAALGRQGREGPAAAARGGRRVSRRHRRQGGRRDPAGSGRDRLRGRIADGREPAGPAVRDGAQPHQARSRPARHAGAGPDRSARLRPGHARRDRALEAAQERRPEDGAPARHADGRPGAAHRGPGEPHEDDRGDGRAHADLQQEAPRADAQRAHLPRRLRGLRPALGGEPGRAGPGALGVPVRHRQLQELQRHERAPGGRQAAAGARGPRQRGRAQGRHLRPLRRRGVPVDHAAHERAAGALRSREDPRAARRRTRSPSPTSSRSG